MAVKPRNLSFGQVGKGETANREFELTINEPGKVKITGVTVDNESFSVKLTEGEPAGNSKYKIELTNTNTIGPISGKVLIALEGSENDKVEVPVRATVVGDLRYSRSVYLNKRDGEFPTRDIVFTRRSGKEVVIKKVEDQGDNLKVELKTPKGKKAAVTVAVANPDNDYSKPVRNTLNVHVQDADQPVVEIRYTITDRPRPKSPNIGKRSSTKTRFMGPVGADKKAGPKAADKTKAKAK